MSTRLATGGRLLNKSRAVSFTFNGQHMTGYEGDTLASALLANDQMLVGRSSGRGAGSSQTSASPRPNCSTG